MTANEINNFFGISESFMLPERLMALLFHDEITELFEKYTQMQTDLSCDGFTDYFQEEHSNRKAMMQDFTPRELTELVGEIAIINDKPTSCLDVCSGTGGLTIALHSLCPECTFFCEELSKRAIPILLFNLAVRNIAAYVTNKDVLSGEVFGAWQIVSGEKFGSVVAVENVPDTPVDVCITNPPYSLKHEFDEKNPDERFCEYGYPPKQFADFGFILHGMHRLKENGRLVAILPHGVLFRNNRESDIRRKLIDNGKIKAVIGLPDKLFLNTGIPVAVIVFGGKPTEHVAFIDASKDYVRDGKINRMRGEDCEKVLSALASQADMEKYLHIATKSEIIENDYNLNIPRYVDTYEPPPPIDIVSVTREICEIKRECFALDKKIFEAICELTANDPKTAAELQAVKEMFKDLISAERRRQERPVQLVLEDLLL